MKVQSIKLLAGRLLVSNLGRLLNLRVKFRFRVRGAQGERAPIRQSALAFISKHIKADNNAYNGQNGHPPLFNLRVVVTVLPPKIYLLNPS